MATGDYNTAATLPPKENRESFNHLASTANIIRSCKLPPSQGNHEHDHLAKRHRVESVSNTRTGGTGGKILILPPALPFTDPSLTAQSQVLIDCEVLYVLFKDGG
jgi:hypothetical protein